MLKARIWPCRSVTICLLAQTEIEYQNNKNVHKTESLD